MASNCLTTKGHASTVKMQELTPGGTCTIICGGYCFILCPNSRLSTMWDIIGSYQRLPAFYIFLRYTHTYIDQGYTTQKIISQCDVKLNFRHSCVGTRCAQLQIPPTTRCFRVYMCFISLYCTSYYCFVVGTDPRCLFARIVQVADAQLACNTKPEAGDKWSNSLRNRAIRHSSFHDHH